MSIVRAARPESSFYVLNKSISEDKRLSWAARGMLVFLLGKPDDWQVSIAHLMDETGGGRDEVDEVVAELIEAGYMVRRSQIRDVKPSEQAVALGAPGTDWAPVVFEDDAS